MNKKIITSSILVFLVVVSLIGFGSRFYYSRSPQVAPTPSQEAQQQSQTPAPSQEQPTGDGVLANPQIELKGENHGLIICADKCGDGICQDKVVTCADGNLNCSCQESKEECPSDCK